VGQGRRRRWRIRMTPSRTANFRCWASIRAAISWSGASCCGDRATADLHRAGKSFEDGYRPGLRRSRTARQRRPQAVRPPKAALDFYYRAIRQLGKRATGEAPGGRTRCVSAVSSTGPGPRLMGDHLEGRGLRDVQPLTESGDLLLVWAVAHWRFFAIRVRRLAGSSLKPIGHRPLRVHALRPATSRGNVPAPAR
jgi:hypothetical protein